MSVCYFFGENMFLMAGQNDLFLDFIMIIKNLYNKFKLLEN